MGLVVNVCAGLMVMGVVLVSLLKRIILLIEKLRMRYVEFVSQFVQMLSLEEDDLEFWQIYGAVFSITLLMLCLVYFLSLNY